MNRRIRILFCLVALVSASKLFAQDPNWNSLLTVNSYPSPYFNDWERDPSIGNILITTLMGTPETEFYCKLKISLNPFGTIIEGKSSSLIIPAGPQTQFYTYNDIVDWKDVDYNESLYETIIRSGRLLEGEYGLCVSVYKKSNNQLLTESCSNFYIVYPNPPQLIEPMNASTISNSITTPTFMWTAVNTPAAYSIQYHFKIVERLANQALERAIESNPVHHEADIIGLTSYTYPPDALPFENGKEYVWQVTATDDKGFAPSANNGKSEVWSFFFGTNQQNVVLELDFDDLMLEENFVYLNNIKQLEITEDNFGFVLNGSTTLELKFPGLPSRSIPTSVENLSFSKGSYTPPIFTSGRISGILSPNDIPANLTGPYFKPQDFEYTPSSYLTIGGMLEFPGSMPVPLQGRITLQNGALSGDATIIGSSVVPLMSFGSDPVSLKIIEAAIHFSQPTLTLKAELQIFNETVQCNIPDIVITNQESFEINVNCTSHLVVPLIPGYDFATLSLRNITGTITPNLFASSLDYELLVSGSVDLKYQNQTFLGADVVLSVKPTGVDVVSFTPRGGAILPEIDLGWLKLAFENFASNSLSYTGGNWDFNFGSDLTISFPKLDGLTLPQLSGSSFSKSGFNLPAINFSGLVLPRVNLDLFEFEFLALRLLPFTVDWSSWSSNSFSGLNFQFDFNMRMPHFPSGASNELRNLVFSLNGVSFQNGNFNFNLPDLSFPSPGLELPFGSDLIFNVLNLSGSFDINFGGGVLNISPNILLGGKFQLPNIFNCAGNDNMYSIPPGSLHLSGDGQISGVVDNVIPRCPLTVGQLQVAITNSSLRFAKNISEQQLILDGSGTISLNGQDGTIINAQATFSYDLIRNKLLSLTAQINAPFVWNIPSDPAVLSFNLNSATITNEELIIDGRQSLKLSGGENIGVTFNNLHIKLSDLTVTQGNVIFDTPFALKGIINGDQLAYKAVSIGSNLFEQSAVLLNLPNSIGMNANGFAVSGTSSCNLRYEGRDLTNLSAVFSNNFAFVLNEFKVAAGQCEIFHSGNRVAVLNASGFFPDASYLAQTLLPDRLPLLSESIAYLVLKEDGQLLVDHSLINNNLNLKTRAGQPIKMVLPALQFNKPLPPEALVSFDITIDQLTKELVDGSILLQVPNDQLGIFNLTDAGIPFEITEIFFGNVEGQNAFRFGGNLKIFSVVQNLNKLNLILSSDGRLTGSFDFDLNKVIQLVENSDKVNLNLSHINGTFNCDLLPASLGYDLNLSGGIKLNLGRNNNYGAQVQLGLTPEGIQLRQVTPDNLAQHANLNLGWINLKLSEFSIQSLAYHSNPGWEFELMLSVAFGFPDLNFDLPKIQGIKITKDGFIFPQTSFPNLRIAVKSFNGFGIQPLAFRMQPFTFNWFQFDGNLGNWGLSFDFALSFPQFPAGAAQQLKELKLSILNASYIAGKINGNIVTQSFTDQGLLLPLGNVLNFYVKEAGGVLSVINDIQNFNLTFKGNIQLPEALKCQGDNGITDISNTVLSFNSKGQISGSVRNFVPHCPLNLGIAKFVLTGDSLVFSTDLRGKQQAVFHAGGNLKLPAQTQGDSVSASGKLKIDLAAGGEIIDGSIAINNAFKFQLPVDNPLLSFIVNNATFDSRGLMINGRHNIILNNDALIAVRFNNLLFNHKTLSVTSGSVTLNNQFAIKVALIAGGMQMNVVSNNFELTETSALRLNLPANVIIDKNGLKLNGSSTVLVRWQNSNFANISCEFTNDFTFGLSPFAVKSGVAIFKNNGTEVARLDQNGFVPTEFFNVVIPEKLPLPDITIAYLQLKTGNNLNILYERIAEGLRIYSRPNTPVDLVVPGLKYNSPTDRRYPIIFDVVVNPSTWQFVRGEILVGLQSPISLSNNGIPISVDTISFSSHGGTYAFRASGKINLPSAISNLSVRVRNITLASTGLSGSIQIGEYMEESSSDASYIKIVDLGNIKIKLQGIEANFGQGANSFKLSGDITSELFRTGNDTTKIHYFAQWNQNAFTFNLRYLNLPDGKLPINIARFQPTGTTTLNFPNGGDWNISFSGILSFPTLNDQFRFSIVGMNISRNSITIPELSISNQAGWQIFKLFNSDFTLKNVGNAKAVTFSYQNHVLYCTLNGNLKIFNKTADFKNLKVGSDGTLQIDGVFVSGNINVITDYLTITRLGIISNPELKLEVAGRINLPKPVNQLTNEFTLRISPDGTVEGGSDIAFINEQQGLGGQDNSEYNFWIAKFDPTYLGLHLDFNNMRNSSIRLVADIYFQNDPAKRIGLGNTNPLAPGLEIKFNGAMQWKNISASMNLGEINWDMVKLSDLQAGISEGDDFILSLSGKLGISVGSNSVTGRLEFADLGIDADANVIVGANCVKGGDLKIVDVVTISVSNVSFSNQRSTIQIKSGTLPSGGSNGTSREKSIETLSHFRFTGQIDIAGVASGGIEEFLAYKTQNSTSLLIRNANFTIQDVVQFSADMEFEQVQGRGYRLLVGGKGTLSSTEIILVGKIAKMNNQSSFGFFVAATGLQIRVGPVKLSGLGGGFFYNPTAEDLGIVTRLAGFTDGITNSKISASPGSFAILLFAQAAIVEDYLVQGKALLTITEEYFALYGKLTILNQGDRITGNITLMIGFENGYAEGNININVNMANLITGTGNLDFYVYGSDFGINGRMRFSVINILNGGGDLLINNNGFMVAMSVSYDFDIWIIEINSGFETKLWYKREANNWGAYCKAYISAEVLEGLASASGWLECGLMGNEGNFYIYGVAGLEVSILWTDWSGSVWAKLANGRLDGGFGSDDEMERLIHQAKSNSQEMQRASAAAQDRMRSAMIAGFNLTDEEMTSAFMTLFNNAQQYGYYDTYQIFNDEQTFGGLEGSEEQALLWVKENVWTTGWMPNSDQKDRLIATRNSIDEDITTQNNLRDASATKLSQVISNPILDELTSRNYEFAGDPVSALDFSLPVAVPFRDPSTGKWSKRLLSQPHFSIDNAKQESNKNTLEQADQDFKQFETDMANRITALENGIDIVNEALGLLNSAGSYINASQGYKDLIGKIEGFYKDHSTYYTQISQNSSALFRTLQIEKAVLIRDAINSKTNRISRDHKFYCSRARARHLLRLIGKNDSNLEPYLQSSSAWNDLSEDQQNEVCNNKGMELWLYMNQLGLQSVDSAAQKTCEPDYDELNALLQQIETAQTTYTASIDSVYAVKAPITENLYDIYARYQYWKSKLPADRQEQQPMPFTTIRRKVTNLTNMLKVPQITDLRVTATNNDFYSTAAFQWNANFPQGNQVLNRDYSVLIQSNTGTQNPETGFQCIGFGPGMTRIYLQHTNERSINKTLYLRARSGVGYSNTRILNFSPSFGPGGGGGTTVMRGDETAPTRPIVSFADYISKQNGYVNNNPVYLYLSNDKTKISVQWISDDPQSGVIDYQYRIIASPSNSVVVDQTPIGGRTNYTIMGLNLTQGQKYKVQIRAKNGAGLWSAYGDSPELMIDETAPSVPTIRIVQEPINMGLLADLMIPATVYPPIQLPEELENGASPNAGLVVLPTKFGAAAPMLNIYWNASTDNESGVLEYRYRVVSISDPTKRSELISVGNQTLVQISGGILSYHESFYVYVYAVNLLGAESSPLRVGPVTPIDYTVPKRPKAALANGPVGGCAYLIFSDLGEDKESGIWGYQIAIGTSLGSTNIKAWNDSVDFKPADICEANSWRIPNYDLPNGTYYISYRAKNNQKYYCGYNVTEPYIIDNTPPATPRVTVTTVNKAGGLGYNLKLTFANIQDQQSGIIKLEYAVSGPQVDHIIIPATSVNVNTSNVVIDPAALGMKKNSTYTFAVQTTNGVYRTAFGRSTFKLP